MSTLRKFTMNSNGFSSKPDIPLDSLMNLSSYPTETLFTKLVKNGILGPRYSTIRLIPGVMTNSEGKIALSRYRKNCLIVLDEDDPYKDVKIRNLHLINVFTTSQVMFISGSSATNQMLQRDVGDKIVKVVNDQVPLRTASSMQIMHISTAWIRFGPDAVYSLLDIKGPCLPGLNGIQMYFNDEGGKYMIFTTINVPMPSWLTGQTKLINNLIVPMGKSIDFIPDADTRWATRSGNTKYITTPQGIISLEQCSNVPDLNLPNRKFASKDGESKEESINSKGRDESKKFKLLILIKSIWCLLEIVIDYVSSHLRSFIKFITTQYLNKGVASNRKSSINNTRPNNKRQLPNLSKSSKVVHKRSLKKPSPSEKETSSRKPISKLNSSIFDALILASVTTSLVHPYLNKPQVDKIIDSVAKASTGFDIRKWKRGASASLNVAAQMQTEIGKTGNKFALRATHTTAIDAEQMAYNEAYSRHMKLQRKLTFINGLVTTVITSITQSPLMGIINFSLTIAGAYSKKFYSARWAPILFTKGLYVMKIGAVIAIFEELKEVFDWEDRDVANIILLVTTYCGTALSYL